MLNPQYGLHSTHGRRARSPSHPLVLGVELWCYKLQYHLFPPTGPGEGSIPITQFLHHCHWCQRCGTRACLVEQGDGILYPTAPRKWLLPSHILLWLIPNSLEPKDTHLFKSMFTSKSCYFHELLQTRQLWHSQTLPTLITAKEISEIILLGYLESKPNFAYNILPKQESLFQWELIHKEERTVIILDAQKSTKGHRKHET